MPDVPETLDELAARRPAPSPLDGDPGNRAVAVGDIVYYKEKRGRQAGSLAVVMKVTDHDTVTLQRVTAEDLEDVLDGTGNVIGRRPKKGHSFGTPFLKNVPRFIARSGDRPNTPHWQIIQ